MIYTTGCRLSNVSGYKRNHKECLSNLHLLSGGCHISFICLVWGNFIPACNCKPSGMSQESTLPVICMTGLSVIARRPISSIIMRWTGDSYHYPDPVFDLLFMENNRSHLRKQLSIYLVFFQARVFALIAV